MPEGLSYTPPDVNKGDFEGVYSDEFQQELRENNPSDLIENKLEKENIKRELRTKFAEINLSQIRKDGGDVLSREGSTLTVDELMNALDSISNEDIKALDDINFLEKVTDLTEYPDGEGNTPFDDGYDHLNDGNLIFYHEKMTKFLDRYPNKNFLSLFPEGYFNNEREEWNKKNYGYSYTQEYNDNKGKIIESLQQFQTLVKNNALPATLNQFDLENNQANQKIISQLILLKGRSDEAIEIYDKDLELFNKTLQEFESIGEFDIPTEKLSDEKISNHLKLRNNLLRHFFSRKNREKFYYFIAGSLQDQDSIEKNGSVFERLAEQETTYASFILAPKASSKSFTEMIKNAFSNVVSNIEESPDDFRNIPDYVLGKAISGEIYNQINTQSEHFYDQYNAVEIGGTDTAEALDKMGADVVEADAGHSGYSTSYSAGSRESMVDLSNYTKYGQPHSADLICSSKLFDMGSGIGNIAETENLRDREALGAEEMALLMTNLLKENGFMVHFDGPPPKNLRDELGIKEVSFLEGVGAYIFRYNPDYDSLAKDRQLGKKSVAFNNESKTYELV